MQKVEQDMEMTATQMQTMKQLQHDVYEKQ